MIEGEPEKPEKSPFPQLASLREIIEKMEQYNYVGLISKSDIQVNGIIIGGKKVLITLAYNGVTIAQPEYADKLKGILSYFTSESTSLHIEPLGFRKGKQLAFVVNGEIIKTLNSETMEDRYVPFPIGNRNFGVVVTIEPMWIAIKTGKQTLFGNPEMVYVKMYVINVINLNP